MPCSLKDWIPGMEQRPAGAHPSTLGCRVPSRKDMGHGWSMSLRKSVFILFHHLTCCCVLKCHTNIRLTALHSQPKKKKEVQLPVCGYCGYMQQLESTENQTLMFCWFWLDWRVIFFLGRGLDMQIASCRYHYLKFWSLPNFTFTSTQTPENDFKKHRGITKA